MKNNKKSRLINAVIAFLKVFYDTDTRPAVIKYHKFVYNKIFVTSCMFFKQIFRV